MKTPIAYRLRAVEPKKEAPIGGLMDKRFIYVPVNKTDVAATFARIRAEQQKGKQ